MAWSAPMTAVDTGYWFASDFNKFIRDNLNQTAPAKATEAGQYFVSDQTQLNSLVPRKMVSDTIATAETRSATFYGDLATVGPRVTLTTGTAVLILLAAKLSNNTAEFQCHTAVAISGACNFPAHGDHRSFRSDGKSLANQPDRGMGFGLIPSLTPGVNTFTMKYKVGGGTGTFSDRHMVVMPLS